MQTRYKYIRFEVIEAKRKTDVWGCYNNHSNGYLGCVKWYSRWRQYCFNPAHDTVFNDTCLDDVSHFLKQLRAGRKPENKTEGGG